jgi:hypothetical protein
MESGEQAHERRLSRMDMLLIGAMEGAHVVKRRDPSGFQRHNKVRLPRIAVVIPGNQPRILQLHTKFRKLSLQILNSTTIHRMILWKRTLRA